ncbi:MAG: hypothetical protein R2860_13050 [Desulfobacterales bacterium]
MTENTETVIKLSGAGKTASPGPEASGSIGALAGGITHDFNNILSSIYGYSQLALLELPGDNTVRAYLRRICMPLPTGPGTGKADSDFQPARNPRPSPVEVGIIVKEGIETAAASIPATVEEFVKI